MLANAATHLRGLMRSTDLIWGPGVYDGISARIAAAVGFPMLYMTGAGTAASRIGEPDLGLTTLSEMAENARTIARASNVPVIADADTGFGGPINVARTVHLYEGAGVAGLHIEDQMFPKRCGHLQGKIVVSADEFAQRIRAAANERYNPDFVIIARTDARQPHGFDEAMARIKLAFECGADVGFFEGPTSLAEIERVIAEAPGPMMLNLATNGSTPSLRVREVEAYGFKFAIWPAATITAAALGIQTVLAELKETGTDVGSLQGLSPRDVFAMVGLDEAIEIDRRSGSSALSTV